MKREETIVRDATYRKIVGERLRQLRTEKNLSQAMLAEKETFNQGIVSKIERGEIAPSLHELVVLSNKLEVSIDYLVTGQNCDVVNS